MSAEQPFPFHDEDRPDAEVIPLHTEQSIPEKIQKVLKETGRFVGQVALVAFFWRESD